MKISRLMVRGYQQFEDLDLDLTDASGKPLERVCFLGTNGTGKTTLLRILEHVLGTRGPVPSGGWVTFFNAGATQWAATVGPAGVAWLGGEALSSKQHGLMPEVFGGRFPHAARRDVSPLAGQRDLVAIVGADGAMTLSHDPPSSTLNDALVRRSKSILIHHVGPHTADLFWRELMLRLAERQESFRSFLALEENRKRTVEDVETDFVRANPEVLPELASLWNRLLQPAGLELDLEDVRLPSQLTDSLAMHVRVTRTKEKLPYNALSSGMRSFLFRLGYLKTLFFEPPTGSSFVLVDEPEASLHPDFLYDIVDVYQSVCVGSQLFFATHSPIVAAQFKPEERVILEFDENRFVKARRGVAPEGDDPNDLLSQDFHVRSILGKEGVKKWKRFLELDELMRRETDAAQREKYRREYMEIGAAYHFEPRTDA